MATQKQVAEHVDLSARAVRDYMKSGVMPTSKGPGGYDLDACRVAYIRHLRGRASGQVSKSPSDLDLTTERARKEKAQADKTELEVAKMRGELVEADAVRHQWTTMLGRIRQRLLVLASTLAPLVQAETEYQECFRIIQDGVYHALEDAAEYGETADASDVGTEAAAETDGKRVGRPAQKTKSGK